MTDDPRERFLIALRRDLRGGPLTRGRIVREIAAHLDDIVAELEQCGGPEDPLAEALRRLGDVGTITSAFRAVRPKRRRWARVGSLRSPAWIAVAAMSVVTAWVADLPQTSGAKVTTRARSSIPSREFARAIRTEHRPSDNRHPLLRAHHLGRP